MNPNRLDQHPMSNNLQRTARRTHSFTESVIREMTRVAREHNAVNLAQGFPDFPAPELLKESFCIRQCFPTKLDIIKEKDLL